MGYTLLLLIGLVLGFGVDALWRADWITLGPALVVCTMLAAQTDHVVWAVLFAALTLWGVGTSRVLVAKGVFARRWPLSG